MAHEKYAAAKQMAESQGFDYVPSDVLLRRSFAENLSRLLAAAGTEAQPTPPEVVDATLGGVEVVLSRLRVILQEFILLTKTKHLCKSDRQRHLWRLPRERAVANFEKVVPGKANTGIDRITREDALAFRAWWAARIKAGETQAATANKDLGHLSRFVREWCELKRHVRLANPFAKLRFGKGIDDTATKSPFSKDWVRERSLAPGALDGLNDEA